MNYETKRTLSRIGAIVMACLMVGGVIWSGIQAFMDKPRQSAATYPPVALYEGDYYVLTGLEAMDLPEDLTQIYIKSVGDQEMIPTEDGTCNFGSGLMVFQMGEDKAYIQDKDGDWLICEKIEEE